MVKLRKLPDNFTELVPTTILDTEGGWGVEGAGRGGEVGRVGAANISL